MPSVFSHAVVALALGPAFRRAGWPARLWWAGALCAVLPDADVVGFYAGVPLGSVLGHRGLTHSLAFAAVLAAVLVPLGLRPFLSAWGVAVLASEALWVWLPATLFAALTWWLTRPGGLPKA